MPTKKTGLYANIHAKQERIAHGSGEKMRKPGSEGAPTEESFRKADKTAHQPKAKSAAKSPKKAAGKSKAASGAKPKSSTKKTTARKAKS